MNYRSSREAAESVVNTIESQGARAVAVAADVAVEYRVNQFVPMKRGGSADEVARAILWLLSDEASYTTGSFVDVTGGK